MITLLVILLVLWLVGGFPAMPYYGPDTRWGYGPWSVGTVLLIVLLVLLLTHTIRLQIGGTHP